MVVEMYMKGDAPEFPALEDMPTPGYTAPELERLLHLSNKRIYRLIAAGELDAYKDVTGQMRIHPAEIYRWMREKQKDK